MCLPKVDSPATAKQFVEEYDRQCNDPTSLAPVHRVATYLASEAPGCLGSDLRRFAAGLPMSKPLRQEISAYQLCVLDDSMQESPHAMVSKVAAKGPHTSIMYWSGIVRYTQNNELANLVKELGTVSFERLFERWQCIGQRSSKQFWAMVPRRQRPRDIRLMVYRAAEHNLVDYDFLKALGFLALGSPQPLPAKAIDSPEQALFTDYLHRVFSAGSYFTLADNTDVCGYQCIGLSRDAQASGQQSLGVQCFQIVSKDIVKKKHVLTHKLRRERAMRLPAMVQKFRLWNSVEYPGQCHDMFADGEPVTIDLKLIASFQAIYEGLYQWKPQVSDVHGCLAIRGAELVRDCQWCPQHLEDQLSVPSHCTIVNSAVDMLIALARVTHIIVLEDGHSQLLA